MRPQPRNDGEAEAEWKRVDRTDKFQNVTECSAEWHAALIGLSESEGFDFVVGVE